MGLDGFFVLVRVEIWDKTIQDYAYADILFIQQLFSRSLELELNFSAIRLGFHCKIINIFARAYLHRYS